MKVQSQELDDAVVISLTGEMMLGYEANDFQEAIENALHDNKKKIVVDLSNLKFISSWGIGILIYGHTTVTNKGGTFTLAAVPDTVNDALIKTKLDSILNKAATVKDAVND